MAGPNPFTLSSFSKEKHDYMGLFDVERWYDDLARFTFHTRFVALTKEMCCALMREYRMNCLNATEQRSEDHKDLMEGLKTMLHVVDTEFTTGAFVRLSTRSPKDAVLEGHEAFRVLYEELLCELVGGDRARLADPPLNEAVKAGLEASTRALCSNTGEDALWMLTHSERTFTDLRHAVEHYSGEEWTMKLVVREWCPDLRLHHEFRTFVCNSQVTAITQYDDACFHKELEGREDEIMKRITEFISTFMDRLAHLSACVVDIALGKDGACWVIELNPFGPVTGASLFDWRTERPLLQGGHDLWHDLGEGAGPSAYGTVLRLRKEALPDDTLRQSLVVYGLEDTLNMITLKYHEELTPDPGGCAVL